MEDVIEEKKEENLAQQIVYTKVFTALFLHFT